MMVGEADRTATRRAFLAGAGSLAAASVAGCTQTTANEGIQGLTGSMDISGSSTVFPLTRAIRKEFLEEYPRVSISLMSTGSGGGFQNHFCPGDTDFNNASRPIQSVETAHCAANEIEPIELTVATDALTVIVNDENDWVDCLTVEQLREIWAADSMPRTWQDVNEEWPDREIKLFGPTDASGTFDYFGEAVLGEVASRRDYQATEQDQQIIQGVQNSQAAIGYLGFAHYSKNEETVKAVAIDNGDGCVHPTLETAKSGEYQPLSRPLFTYVANSSLVKDQVAAFAEFIVEKSTNEAIIADAVGYVPNDERTQQAMFDRLEDAIEEANE